MPLDADEDMEHRSQDSDDIVGNLVDAMVKGFENVFSGPVVVDPWMDRHDPDEEDPFNKHEKHQDPSRFDYKADEFVIDAAKEYNDNVAIESQSFKVIDTGRWTVVESREDLDKLARSDNIIESAPVEEKASDDNIAVPASGALFLCSFLGSQNYVPSFCKGGQARAADSTRQGLTSVCEYYVTRGYRPFFCKDINNIARSNDSDQHQARSVDETVLEQFLQGGGLAPFFEKSLLEEIKEDTLIGDEIQEEETENDMADADNDDEQNSTEVPDVEIESVYSTEVSNNNIEESELSRKRPSFGKLVGGTIAAGAGLALLNHHIRKPRPSPYQSHYNQPSLYRPSVYQQPYSPYVGYSPNYYGSFQGPSFSHFAREQENLVERENKLRKNTFSKLVAGGVGLAAAYHVTYHLFNRRPVNLGYGYSGIHSRPSYGYGYNHGYGYNNYGYGYGRNIVNGPTFINCNDVHCGDTEISLIDEECGPYMYFEHSGSMYFICQDDTVQAVIADDLPSKSKRSTDESDEPREEAVIVNNEEVDDYKIEGMEMNKEVNKQMDVPMVDVVPADMDGNESNMHNIMKQMDTENGRDTKKVVAGGLGLAAGYLLANKFANRPNRYHSYNRPYSHNYYGGVFRPYHPQRPGLFHLPHQRPVYYGYGRENTEDTFRQDGTPDAQVKDIPEDWVELDNLEDFGRNGLSFVEVGSVDESGNLLPDHIEASELEHDEGFEIESRVAGKKPSKGSSLLAGGLGLAAGYYLANKLTQNNRPQPNYGGYPQGHHGGYPSTGYHGHYPSVGNYGGSYGGYGGRPSYGVSSFSQSISRPSFSRPSYGGHSGSYYGYGREIPDVTFINALGREIPDDDLVELDLDEFGSNGFNFVEVGMVDESGNFLADHIEARELEADQGTEIQGRDGDDEKKKKPSKKKPNKGASLLAGGLGLAAGYYLANKFAQNKRPQQNYGGYPGHQGGYPSVGHHGGPIGHGGYPSVGHSGAYPPAVHHGGYPSVGHSGAYPPAVHHGGYPSPVHNGIYNTNTYNGGYNPGNSNSYNQGGSSFGSRPSFGSSSSFSRPSYSSNSFNRPSHSSSSFSHGGSSFGGSSPYSSSRPSFGSFGKAYSGNHKYNLQMIQFFF